MKNSDSDCKFVKVIPDHITRTNKPRVLGMVIYMMIKNPNGLCAFQVSEKLKDEGYKYYPATNTSAALLGKYKQLFTQIGEAKIAGSFHANSWKVKVYKLRDDYNVDRKA